jgi:hypothetical protein
LNIIIIKSDDSLKCNYIDKSYDLCINNIDCSNKFYLKENNDYYKNVFYYLFSMYMHPNTIEDNNDIGIILENVLCENNDIYNNNGGNNNYSISYVKTMWLHMMKSSKICNENEYYELGIGCTCKNGKLCDELSGYENKYRFDLLNITIIILCSITIYVIYNTCKKVNDSHKLILENEKLIKLHINQNNNNINNNSHVNNNNNNLNVITNKDWNF